MQITLSVAPWIHDLREIDEVRSYDVIFYRVSVTELNLDAITERRKHVVECYHFSPLRVVRILHTRLSLQSKTSRCRHCTNRRIFLWGPFTCYVNFSGNLTRSRNGNNFVLNTIVMKICADQYTPPPLRNNWMAPYLTPTCFGRSLQKLTIVNLNVNLFNDNRKCLREKKLRSSKNKKYNTILMPSWVEDIFADTRDHEKWKDMIMPAIDTTTEEDN